MLDRGRELGDRHCNVRRHRFRSRRERKRRHQGVVACTPHLASRGRIALRLERRCAFVLRDLAGRRKIAGDARLGAPELDEEVRRLREARAGERVQRGDGHRVEQLAARHGNTRADDSRRRAASRLDGGEGRSRDDDVLRNRMQPQRQLGDHAERPLGADEQAGEVVPGRALHRARPGAHHAPAREHDLERQHVRAHTAVSHRCRAACIRRRHAAERGVGARVDREPEPVRANGRLELRTRHAWPDRRREIVRTNRDDLVHPRQIEADPTVQRDHVPFEARARTERHDRHADGVGVLEHGRNLRGRLGEDDDVGTMRSVVAEVACVLVEDRVAVADAALVRNELEQLSAQIGRDRHGRRVDGVVAG